MGSRLTGTVKWFNARKGFGFITAKVRRDDAEEQEVFVHQTAIVVGEDGQSFRTLAPSATVEFDLETEAETGKLKALNVTAPGGVPLDLPVRRIRKSTDGNDQGRRGGGPKAPHANKKKKTPSLREAPFHASLTQAVRDKIIAKGIDLDSKGTVDIAIGDARVKLGLGHFAGLAHKDGIVAEGEYACDSNGTVTITWDKAIEFKDGAWQSCEHECLLKTIVLVEDSVGPVPLDETPESLWGDDKTDPREAFERNGFLMRRVVLTRPPKQPKKSQS